MTPYSDGVRIDDRVFPAQGFTPSELASVMYSLTADPDQAQLLLESCSLEDADEVLNPGIDMIAEAVTAVKSQIDRTMTALVRVLNRYASNVKPYDFPSIGPDRKNALFAYKTTTFTFDDGQTVSILFHSPGRDPMKLAATDTLIAYRWMLNRRDITATVAPEKGQDLNLQTMARRIMQLVEENSEKFQANNEKRQEQQERLATLESEQTQANQAVDQLTQQNADLSGQIDDTDARIERLRKRLEIHGEGAREGSGPDPVAAPDNEETTVSDDTAPAAASTRQADYLSRIEQAVTAKDVGAIGVEVENDDSLSTEENQAVRDAIREARIAIEKAERESATPTSEDGIPEGFTEVANHYNSDNEQVAAYGEFAEGDTVAMKSNPSLTGEIVGHVGTGPVIREHLVRWSNGVEARLHHTDLVASTGQVAAGDPENLEALDARLYRDISRSIVVIRGIDNGTEQGYNRSLFSSSIANKLKTQARNGNEDVVDAALLLIAQQSIEHGRPILAKRNAIWSVTGNDMDYYTAIAQRQASAVPVTTASEEEAAPSVQDDAPAPTEEEPSTVIGGDNLNQISSLETLDETLYQDLTRLSEKIREIDRGIGQAWYRSQHSSTIEYKIQRQVRDGNDAVVNSALLMLAQQSIQNGHPILKTEHPIWSATGNDMGYYMEIAQRQVKADTGPAPDNEAPTLTGADRIGTALQALLSETDTTAAMDALEALMDEAEAAGIDIDNDPNMLAASDHITQLLEQENV